MADFVLYTMADPEILAGALQGIAMIFDPSNTDAWVTDTSGGGLGLGIVAGLGLVITLLFVLGRALLTQKLEVMHILIMIVAYIALYVPKTELTVENFITGDVEIVDGIPYGVAIPAALMSGMLKQVGDAFDLAFNDPRFGPVSESGFMDPLDQLMKMRNITGAAGGNNYLRQSMYNYAQICLVGGDNGFQPNLSDGLRKSSSGETIFDPSLIASGIVELYTMDGSGIVTSGFYSCTKKIGARESGAYVMKKEIEKYITPESGAISKINLSADLKLAGVQTAFQNTPGTEKDIIKGNISKLAGSAMVSQDVAMNNLVVGSLMRDVGVKNAVNNPSKVAETIAMEEAMERFKVDSAASGSMFLRTMQSSMDILLFVWIAIAPIVAFTMIMMGIAGLKIVIQYFLFGIWTQSWFPIAIIINYYFQITISKKLERLVDPQDPGSLFSLAYQTELYKDIGLTIASASQLLAYTPVLSLAILTGSYFAMTQLGTSMSGKDGYFDEKKLAHDAEAATGAKARAEAIAAQSSSVGTKMDLATAGAGMSAEGALNRTMPTLQVGAGTSQTAQMQKQHAATRRAELSAAQQNAFSHDTSLGQEWAAQQSDTRDKFNKMGESGTKRWLQSAGISGTEALSKDQAVETGLTLAGGATAGKMFQERQAKGQKLGESILGKEKELDGLKTQRDAELSKGQNGGDTDVSKVSSLNKGIQAAEDALGGLKKEKAGNQAEMDAIQQKGGGQSGAKLGAEYKGSTTDRDAYQASVKTALDNLMSSEKSKQVQFGSGFTHNDATSNARKFSNNDTLKNVNSLGASVATADQYADMASKNDAVTNSTGANASMSVSDIGGLIDGLGQKAQKEAPGAIRSAVEAQGGGAARAQFNDNFNKFMASGAMSPSEAAVAATTRMANSSDMAESGAGYAGAAAALKLAGDSTGAAAMQTNADVRKNLAGGVSDRVESQGNRLGALTGGLDENMLGGAAGSGDLLKQKQQGLEKGGAGVRSEVGENASKVASGISAGPEAVSGMKSSGDKEAGGLFAFGVDGVRAERSKALSGNLTSMKAAMDGGLEALDTEKNILTGGVQYAANEGAKFFSGVEGDVADMKSLNSLQGQLAGDKKQVQDAGGWDKLSKGDQQAIQGRMDAASGIIDDQYGQDFGGNSSRYSRKETEGGKNWSRLQDLNTYLDGSKEQRSQDLAEGEAGLAEYTSKSVAASDKVGKNFDKLSDGVPFSDEARSEVKGANISDARQRVFEGPPKEE